MNNRELYAVHQHALSLYKDIDLSHYEPEVRMIVAVLLAYKAVAQRELGQEIPFKLQARPDTTPIDDL